MAETIYFVCTKCGNLLETYPTIIGKEINIMVVPCDRCSQDQYNDGYTEGYNEGYGRGHDDGRDAGYEDGYERGRAEAEK